MLSLIFSFTLLVGKHGKTFDAQTEWSTQAAEQKIDLVFEM